MRRYRPLRGITAATLTLTLNFALTLPSMCAPGTPPRSRDADTKRDYLETLIQDRPVVNRILTIDEAVTIALKESPIVRGAVDELDAAQGRLSADRARTGPYVTANTFVSGGSNANSLASPTLIGPQMIQQLPRNAYFDQNLMAMYPLYSGGRLSALARKAAALESASAAGAEGRKQEVALLTRAAYRAVIARRALVAVQQARVRDDEERLRLDCLRLGQEQIPAYYVQRDEAAGAGARQDLTNALRDTELSLIQLETVMGVSPASRVEVTGTTAPPASRELIASLIAPVVGSMAAAVPPDSDVLPPDLEALLRVAEWQRPELRAAEARVMAAAEDARAVRGGYRPQVSAFGMGDLSKARGQRGPFAGTTYGVVAAVPLYDSGQRQADTRTADADRRREEQDRARIGLEIIQDVRNALLNLRAAEQNVATAKVALESAREEYRVADLRYQSGRSIVTDSLDALTARVHAESNVVQATYEYDSAADQLRRAVGETPR